MKLITTPRLDSSDYRKFFVKAEKGDLRTFLASCRGPLRIECKLDGEGVIAEVNDTVSLANNHDATYTRSEWRPSFSCQSGVFQCEYINGLGKIGSVYAPPDGLAVYDVLFLNGEDIRMKPLQERLELLKGMNFARPISLSYDADNAKDSILAAKEVAIEAGYEGVVVKDLASTFGAKWLKLKKRDSDDFVIMGVKKTDSFLRTGRPESFVLGQYINGQLMPVGTVSSARKLDGFDLKSAIGHILSYMKTREDKETVYLTPNLVGEVSYLSRTATGLREPVLEKLRHDKPPTECKPDG